MILRTAEEKANLELSWSRPDEEFFASGACHVLCAAFLIVYPTSGFEGWRIIPKAVQRGGHVLVMRGRVVFDCTGYHQRDVFLAEYSAALRRFFPEWDADFRRINVDPIGWEFCRATGSRHPSQFLHDPLPRALAFVSKFAPPDQCG